MQGLKFVLVAALAVFAVGTCEAARFRRSPTEFDIRLLVETARDLSNTLFKHLTAGLDEAHPNVEKLLNEMAPEARDGLREIIKDLRDLIRGEEDRFKVIFSTLVKALDDLKPIKAPCADKVAKDAKKIANDVEREMVKFIEGLEVKYEKVFTAIQTGTENVIGKARKLFDAEIPAIVKCLTPKNKDATKCLNAELDKTLAGVTEIGTDLIFLIMSSDEALTPVVNEFLAKVVEQVLKVLGEGRPVLNKISDCVAAM